MVRLKSGPKKAIEKLSKKDQDRMLAAFEKLSLDPFIGKKLSGEFEGHCSVRVWPYRIVYKIYKNELLVLVIKIGHRQGVYNFLVV